MTTQLSSEPAFTWRKLRWLLGSLSVKPIHTLNAHRSTVAPGLTFSETQESEHYTRLHTIEDGIERIAYIPKQRRFDTPLFMQHGMWHGAWCWRPWQELFAEWGWYSLAASLPGHAGSPAQRPIVECTLDYYLGFVRAEIQRLPASPVYLGHSMGGALGQWYLKYVSDDLPAMILAASWVSHNALLDGMKQFQRQMPDAVKECFQTRLGTPLAGTPERAAMILLSSASLVTANELFAQLGPESGLVTFQHAPPFWFPPQRIQTPMLWVAAEKDNCISLAASRRSARHYRAEYLEVKDAAHNLMMEPSYAETARCMHEWLVMTVS